MKEEVMIIILLGVIFALFIYANRQLPRNKSEDPPKIIAKEITPMTLRNGYGVTRDKNPTFAEQWVNIMNYSGESQREEFYEEAEGAYPEDNLG